MVTPFRLFLSVVAGLASGTVESLADLLREFNHQNGVAVAYKAFYNRLAREGFVQFMRQMLARLIERLCIQTLAPTGHIAIARFTDIVIQDGSSFALKKQLRDVFPGRFTKTGLLLSRFMSPTVGSLTGTSASLGVRDQINRTGYVVPATARRKNGAVVHRGEAPGG